MAVRLSIRPTFLPFATNNWSQNMIIKIRDIRDLFSKCVETLMASSQLRWIKACLSHKHILYEKIAELLLERETFPTQFVDKIK